jgi:hypothetical protein
VLSTQGFLKDSEGTLEEEFSLLEVTLLFTKESNALENIGPINMVWLQISILDGEGALANSFAKSTR